MTSPANQILVVEDDPVSRRLLELALTRQGYAVITAENALEAMELLGPAKIDSVSCVVTDYLMPEVNGLELLAWIHQLDPALATILVTAQGEKQLVAESLRGGAADFLDKPVDLKKLHASVARAVAQTTHQRHLAQSASAVKEIGLTQKRLLDAGLSHCQESVQVHYFPRHEAGGDFFTHFRTAPGQLCCLLTDVSGHDLHAAYVSAYFQGFARGLSKHGASMEEVCAEFNRFLLDEFNNAFVSTGNGMSVEISVAVGAILLDSETGLASVITQGIPAPVYLPADGLVQPLGESGGAPLGWFPALKFRASLHGVANGGSLYIWTDGLEDLAEREDVNVLSLAYAVQQAQGLPCLANATDDVLLAVIHLPAPHQTPRTWWPVFAESYDGGQWANIDPIQACWQRSLTLAVPDLTPAQLHDVLLASRELLLNALHHGCAANRQQTAHYQVDYHPALGTIRVRVDDPGPGHDFDIPRHESLMEHELVDAHRGLVLVKRLASHLRLERKGATVILEFNAPVPADLPA